MKLKEIALCDVRTFEGEHSIALHGRLNVLVGRNNVGKSTVLRAPELVAQVYRAGGVGNAGMSFARRAGQSPSINLSYEAEIEFLNDFIGPFLAHLRKHTKVKVMCLGNDREIETILTTEPLGGWTAAKGLVEFRVGLEIGGAGGGGPTFALRVDGQDYVRWSRAGYGQVSGLGLPELVDLPDPTGWMSGLKQAMGSSACVRWSHRDDTERLVVDDPALPRVYSDDQDAVKRALQDLLLRHHDTHGASLMAALARCLPEFSRFGTRGVDYVPCFYLGDLELTRSLVGSGSWAFLAIMVAARAAKATGASTLVLDEPHLYLHPGLERQLVRELTDPERWGGEPLQLVVATHSPVFLDAASRTGHVILLDWVDDERTSVRRHALASDDGRKKLTAVAPAASFSDLLYADRVVFVEGPSDREALHILTGGQSDDGLTLRFEALQQSDRLRDKDVVSMLQVLARGASALGGPHRPVLFLDADKKDQLSIEWDKWGADHPSRCFEIIWAGTNGHDLESLFVESAFLLGFLKDLGADSGDPGVIAAVDSVVTHLATTKNPSSKADKASQHLAELVGKCADPKRFKTKEDLLSRLATFFKAAGERYPLPGLSARLKDITAAAAQTGQRR